MHIMTMWVILWGACLPRMSSAERREELAEPETGA
ncbi:MAG: hypothetical protein JWQ23_4420 [Herminiimonas sp.]|nr:hypothetical protein [Herminiimonas sp.]